MTSEQECYVYIVLPGQTEFVTAARFQVSETRDGVSIGTLIYGKTYLARPEAVEIDPVELRLGGQQYQTVRMNGFFGAIRDSMPDFWGRKVIELNEKRMLEEFDYLLLGPDDRAGALGFGRNVNPPAPLRQFNQTMDLAKLQEIAERIMSGYPIEQVDNQNAAQVQTLLLKGTSMGGARPKAVVEDGNKLWIAKFSTPQDTWNQPVAEKAMLDLAKRCGLNVPENKITLVAGKEVLLIKRFDREKTAKSYCRYRMVSALTLLKSDDNPTSRDNWSYLLLADEVRRVSSKPREDLRELFSRICFNSLISNLDDHPRNHAILAKEREWRLSPAYDLTPLSVIAKETRFLAMVCGPQGRAARKNNLLNSHARFFLSKEEAESIIDNMTVTIKQEWYNYLRRAGASEKDCTLLANAFVYEGFFY